MAPPEIPKTMRGIVIEKTGGTEVLQYQTDLQVPEPKEGEILVRNEFIGVNFIDTYFRSGLYKTSLPAIIGCEAEGTVAALGPNTTTPDLSPGDRVAWIGNAGAYAEYSVATTARAVKVPSSIPATHAAASLIQGLTALTFIRESYAVQRNDWVLVHAAAGGVGLWLCQLLRVVGARTIGTASSSAKMELAKRNGAGWMVDYTKEDVVERVRDITGGHGVMAVFDGVGKDTFETSLEVLALKGSLVSFGNSSGDVPPFQLRRLASKNLKVMRPQVYGYLNTREAMEKYVNELFRLMADENIDIHIHDIYRLEEVDKAHSDLEGRRTTGKLLIQI